jgi:hypothetical protein
MRVPYWLKNLRHRLRGLPQEAYRLAKLKPAAQLSLKVFHADGTITDYGVVSRRVVTTAGVNWLATAFTNTVEAESMNFHDVGTGTNAEAIGNTALQTPYGGARATGTQSTPGSANIYRSVGTITFTSSLAITEHGLFSASSGGTLLDRSVFSAINVVNGDSLQATFELTLPAGG